MSVIAPGGGEVVGDAPDRRVEILCEHDALHATWSRFGPRRDGADLHIHRSHSDLFYVLDGELTTRVGPADEAVVVPAGTLVLVPPLAVHGYRNGSYADVRYLNFHAPGVGFADYMRGLADGRAVAFDQEPPPPGGGDGPATEVAVGAGGFLADGLELLADVEAIGIARVRNDPGAVVPPPHVHHRHLEAFYVLEGELALTLDDRELRAEAGSWVQIPPGVAHSVSFPGAEPARFLNLHAPNCCFGGFLRALHGAAGEEELAAFDQVPIER